MKYYGAVLSKRPWGNGAGRVTVFCPRGDDTPEGLGITLEHIRKGTIKCLVGFVTCFSEAIVGRGCKWVAWPLGMGSVLLVFASRETLAIHSLIDWLVPTPKYQYSKLINSYIPTCKDVCVSYRYGMHMETHKGVLYLMSLSIGLLKGTNRRIIIAYKLEPKISKN